MDGDVSRTRSSQCCYAFIYLLIYLQLLLELLGDKDFLPDTELMKKAFPVLCAVDPNACDNVLGLIMGWDNSDLNSTRLPVITAHEPSGTSIYNMIHWLVFISLLVLYFASFRSAGLRGFNKITSRHTTMGQRGVSFILLVNTAQRT